METEAHEMARAECRFRDQLVGDLDAWQSFVVRDTQHAATYLCRKAS